MGMPDLAACIPRFSAPRTVSTVTRNMPRFCQAGAKFALITDDAYVIGFSLPCVTNCWIVPGWAISAMSGGCPPATAVARTVGRLFPTGL